MILSPLLLLNFPSATLATPVRSQAPVKETAWRLPFKVVGGGYSMPELKQKLRGQKSHVWLQDETLTFLLRSRSEIVRVIGAVQEPMQRLGSSDLWMLRVRMKGWENQIVRYGFFTSDGGEGAISEWRGSRAPASLVRAKTLRGEIVTRSLRSEALGAERGMTIYLPPKSVPGARRAFYMADGQDCRAFAEVLEPLILAGAVAPTAIVGVHNGMLKGVPTFPMVDHRAKEYIPKNDPERFERHIRFFAEEALAYATQEFDLSPRREHRAVFGYSNGGVFALWVALRYPETFGASMPLSPGMALPPDLPLRTPDSPHFYFAAGLLEPFLGPTQTSYHRIRGAGGRAEFRTAFGGHEAWTWLTGFSGFAPLVFPLSR